MGLILLNDALVPAEAAPWADNRGFRYGDGFFETIVSIHGELQNWPQHLARIQRGAATLHLDFPTDFAEKLPTLLMQLVQANLPPSNPPPLPPFRLRWQCWRAGGGFYTPETNRAEWLATAEPLAVSPDEIRFGGRADFAQTVRTAPSALSFLKGPNAALYTLAALEKRARGLDELILLSPDGYVAEATAAALIWVKDGILFTPDTTATGAVAGVRAAALLAKARAAGQTVREGCFLPADLLTADAVATVSVTGIRWLTQVADAVFNPQTSALQAIIRRIGRAD